MNRSDYYVARAAYRAARHADRQWRRDPYAARNVRQVPPNTANEVLVRLPPRVRQALAPQRIEDVTPRQSRFYRNWRAPLGRHCGMELAKRVALRRALQQAGYMSPAEAKADAERMIRLARNAWGIRQSEYFR